MSLHFMVGRMVPVTAILHKQTDNALEGIDHSPPSAFILYQPSTRSKKESLLYNEESYKVLFNDGDEPPSCISSLCLKWIRLLAENSEVPRDGDGVRGPSKSYVDVIHSKRRRYIVRGAVLSDMNAGPECRRQYLFILERLNPGKINLSMIFRKLNLTNREQEIVQLLFAGLSNKEIADRLGISLNTIKGYMKLLSRKLNASNRAGIIAAVVSAK